MSVKWSRRFQTKLSKALTCFSKKRLKVVPVVNDPQYPVEVSRNDRPSINEKSGGFSLVLRSSIFFTAETVLSFLLKLDIQCAVKAVEDSSNRLQDPLLSREVGPWPRFPWRCAAAVACRPASQGRSG